MKDAEKQLVQHPVFEGHRTSDRPLEDRFYFLNTGPRTGGAASKWQATAFASGCRFRGIIGIELDNFVASSDDCHDYCYWHGQDDSGCGTGTNVTACTGQDPGPTSPKWDFDPVPNEIVNKFYSVPAGSWSGKGIPDSFNWNGRSRARVFIDVTVPCEMFPRAAAKNARVTADRNPQAGAPHLYADINLKCTAAALPNGIHR